MSPPCWPSKSPYPVKLYESLTTLSLPQKLSNESWWKWPVLLLSCLNQNILCILLLLNVIPHMVAILKFPLPFFSTSTCTLKHLIVILYIKGKNNIRNSSFSQQLHNSPIWNFSTGRPFKILSNPNFSELIRKPMLALSNYIWFGHSWKFWKRKAESSKGDP